LENRGEWQRLFSPATYKTRPEATHEPSYKI